MKLQIAPLKALCDKKISIFVSELSPFAKVKISASMNFPWAENVKFESYAFFTADSNGSLDLSKQKPDSGTYDFVDSMGLIYSMKMSTGKLADVVKNISANESQFIDIVVECENKKVCTRIERLFKNPEIKSLKVTEDFIGELFYGENPKNKTIVVLGGSDGDSDAISLISALLASYGFYVLAVPYFSREALPKRLAEVPLEYFERVFQWLEKNPITKGNDLYIHGTSKGGELALLLASRYPCIKKAAVFAPHAYCFQGLNYKNVSSWTYDGKQIPFIKLKNSTLFKNILDCFIKNKSFGYTYTYKTCVEAAKNKEEARIKIEKSKADLLLIAGKKDNIWNALDGCEEIVDTLKKCNYKYKYELLPYENGGHSFPLPYIIPIPVTASMKIAPRLIFRTGGNLEGNAYMQKDSWDKTIEFFLN